jgi:hypothetical protein
MFYNFGSAAGPVVFGEAMRPFQVKRQRFLLGIALGYLRDDFSLDGATTPTPTGSARLTTDQIPVLALARWRRTLSPRFELGAELGAGVSFVRTELSRSDKNVTSEVIGTAHPPALVAGAELGIPLRPGRLVVGARYLWVDIGRTSQGDTVQGNSVGLLGDIGYRMAF